MNPADTARLHGWNVGDRLYGGPTSGEPTREVVITAIGEQSVLAKTVVNGGELVNWGESTYAFDCREWSSTPPTTDESETRV